MSWFSKLFAKKIDVQAVAVAAIAAVRSGHTAKILYHLEIARAAIVERMPLDRVKDKNRVRELNEKISTRTKRLLEMGLDVSGMGVKSLDAIISRLK